MSDLILNSLEIQGFRAFDHLKIEKLGQVNLIVGKNNIGKSCLLEAIRLYAHRGSPEVMREILMARDEGSLGYKQVRTEKATASAFDIKYLFYGRSKLFVKGPVFETFSIGPIEKVDLQLSIKAYLKPIVDKIGMSRPVIDILL